jgi:NitT/TauT family transport system substrate-binding protein
MRNFVTLAVGACALLAAAPAARAETGDLRISKGFGIHFLPLYIMEQQKLVEKRAAAAGLGDVTVTYLVIDGGN